MCANENDTGCAVEKIWDENCRDVRQFLDNPREIKYSIIWPDMGRRSKMTPLYWRELQQADLNKVSLIDVRTADEASLNSFPGAINIPLDDLRSRMDEIPTDRPVYLFCGVGLRGYLASNILKGHGYKDVRNLIGGLKLYESAIKPVLPSDQGSHKEITVGISSAIQTKVVQVDACGIQCPGPILKLKKYMEKM